MREVSRSVYLISIYNSILRYHSSQPDETVNSKDHKSEYEKVHLCFPHRQASLSVIYRARTEAISGTPGHRRCREDKTKSVLPKITKSRPLSDFGVSHWVWSEQMSGGVFQLFSASAAARRAGRVSRTVLGLRANKPVPYVVLCTVHPAPRGTVIKKCIGKYWPAFTAHEYSRTVHVRYGISRWSINSFSGSIDIFLSGIPDSYPISSRSQRAY